MREIGSRTFYCPKKGKTVTLIEYTRGEPGGEGICGILSCSHQGDCAYKKSKNGEPLFPWADCPACRDLSSEKE